MGGPGTPGPSPESATALLPQFLEQAKQEVEIRQRILQVPYCYFVEKSENFSFHDIKVKHTLLIKLSAQNSRASRSMDFKCR